MHTCERWCHKGVCVLPDSVCELPCSKSRSLCSHPCNAKCHPETPCPQNVCFEKVKVVCECKRRSIAVLCFKGAPLTSENPDLSRYNGKLKSFGLSVLQQDLLDYLKNGSVQCDEICKVEERNQKMAEGLGLKDVPIDSLIAPTYSEFLRTEARTNKEFVIEIEDVFSDLIRKYKAKNKALDNFNKVKYIYHDFKVMNKDKRRTIHELAEVYKITSQSFDEEPHRNVQVRIGWDAVEPSIKLSQFSQRRVVGGAGAKAVQKPPQKLKEDIPNMQTLSLRTMQREEIVFDSWEDIDEN
jgi:transcriptional repressor NF-X1